MLSEVRQDFNPMKYIAAHTELRLGEAVATVESRASWKAGALGAVGMAVLASATNVAINYATTEATLLRWGAVAVLTLASGIGVALAQTRRQKAEVRAPDKPAVHVRITGVRRTIDFKIYSEEVALQPGYITQWIRTAHGAAEALDQEGPHGNE
ncbi:hypothetical protein [Nonomuraea angiospora]|uniref:hypothetical protein n=1 Tax=Nonomuraea angiospora TaxID=46172 RepID=UPI0029AD9B46|nr:hypothetical protein [Nonomuraea angiospora]MDX3107437.1 hypothetical protein [Nonomuraea angiospora]